MLLINTIDQLKECLLSVEQTGRFVTPVKEFVKAGQIIKPENRNEYIYVLDDLHTIYFQLSEDLIVFKGFQIKPEKHYIFHRLDNLPCSLFYLKNGNLNTTSWYVNGIAVRDNPMQPVVVDRRDGDFWTFQYATSDDGCFEMSHIIYDKRKKGEWRVMDMLARRRGQNMNFKEIKKQFPFVEDITFEDCYDLSKNIFTADQVTLMRMIDI
jgi:hypothetical protein